MSDSAQRPLEGRVAYITGAARGLDAQHGQGSRLGALTERVGLDPFDIIRTGHVRTC
jgi:hypothetical protein